MTDAPPPPPFTTVAEATTWYLDTDISLRDAAATIREEHETFFLAGVVAGHTLIIVNRDAQTALRTIEEVRAYVDDLHPITGSLADMFVHWQTERSHKVVPPAAERHAFYCGAAAFLSLLNRGGEAGLLPLSKEVIEVTRVIDPPDVAPPRPH